MSPLASDNHNPFIKMLLTSLAKHKFKLHCNNKIVFEAGANFIRDYLVNLTVEFCSVIQNGKEIISIAYFTC